MSIIKGIFKRDKSTIEDIHENVNTNKNMMDALALEGGSSSRNVTEDEAMKIPAFKFCLDLISNSIASMPIYLYRENPKDGSVERMYGDKRERLLNEEANDFLNGFNLKKNMVKDLKVYGSSYVHVVKTGNLFQELHPLPSQSIVVEKTIAQGYRVTGGKITLANSESGAINRLNRKLPIFKPHNLIITLEDSEDGLISKGVLIDGATILKQARSEMDYTSSLYENGALPLGILKTAGRLTEEAVRSLSEAWKRLYGGVRNSAKTVVLQEGMDYVPLSMKPDDLQMSETKKATTAEIAKLFGVPENLVNVSAGKQYVSIAQNDLHFVKTTLQPIMAALEASINRALLLEAEKRDGYYFRFDTSELLRTTEKELVDTLVTGLQGGLYSRHEARSKVDLSSKGKDVFVELPGATTSNA